jgi:hypothetical protein
MQELRTETVMTVGHLLRHTIEYAACRSLWVFRFLNGGSRAISPGDYNIERRFVLPSSNGWRWAMTDRAESDHNAVPRLRRRSRALAAVSAVSPSLRTTDQQGSIT